MNDNEILENMDQPEQMGDTTRLPELGLQEQPADMQPTEESVEFDLEDILREFGSGAGASAAEDPSGEEAPVEEPAEESEETVPETSARIAIFLGFLASKSSSTLGRP